MASRATLLRKAAEIIDNVISEHAAILDASKLLQVDNYLDLYKERYLKVEEESIQQLADVYANKGYDISLIYDLDPILQAKLKAFSWRYFPKDPDVLN